MTPQVKFVADALVREQRGQLPGALQRAGGVLPAPLTAYEQQVDVVSQPVEMVAAGVPDVVEWVVEVSRRPALAPPVPRRGVVAAGQADREREEVRPLEGEVGRVERAEAAADRHDFDGSVAVLVDPRQD